MFPLSRYAMWIGVVIELTTSSTFSAVEPPSGVNVRLVRLLLSQFNVVKFTVFVRFNVVSRFSLIFNTCNDSPIAFGSNEVNKF